MEDSETAQRRTVARARPKAQALIGYRNSAGKAVYPDANPPWVRELARSARSARATAWTIAR